MSDRVPTAPHDPVTSRSGSSGSAHTMLWGLLAVAAVVALVVIDVLVSDSASAPRTPYDEVGILQASRFLSGDTDLPRTLSLGYYPGAAFFFAPIWWFTHDAATVYGAAVVINIVLGVLTVVPLSLLGRRLGLTLAQAITVGAVVMLLPARTNLSDYVLSEQALAFFVAWAAYAAFVVWERPTHGRMVLFVLATLAAYLCHARALVLVLVAAVWLLAFLRRRVGVGLVGLVVLAVGAYAVTKGSSLLIDRLVTGGFRQGGGLLDKITGIDGTFVRVTLTQSWSQLVATAGLIAVGAVVLTRSTVTELIRDRVVTATGYVWGVGLAAALLSFLSWSSDTAGFYGTSPRFDAWTYTRYIDPFIMVVVLVALAAMIRGLPRRTLVVAAGLSVAVMAATLLWAIRTIPTWGSSLGPGNNAGIGPFKRYLPPQPFDLPLLPSLTNDNRFWLYGSILVVAAFVCFAVFSRWPLVLVGGIVVVMAVLSYRGNPDQGRDAPLNLARAIDVVEDGDEGGPVDVLLACEGSSQRNIAVNWIGYWFADRDVRLVPEVDDIAPSDRFVIACDDWANPTGAPAVGRSNYGFSVFALDPTDARRLASAGKLRS